MAAKGAAGNAAQGCQRVCVALGREEIIARHRAGTGFAMRTASRFGTAVRAGGVLDHSGQLSFRPKERWE